MLPKRKVLPVMIDVGTNTEKLLKDPLYLGLQEHRLDGDEYVAVIDEFMNAVFTRWPNVIVQFLLVGCALYFLFILFSAIFFNYMKSFPASIVRRK
ncbi:NAD-dependent malic enzyme 62 kDa isoform, mitochondrial-like [Juglans regia]|uniref:NAD-dependent malic enzyme 62 kDa isoform, mitochondrial-like n=1 Tax=Juglans regia TaxID=51240 RepID=A0A6P9EEV6_JUGRE|nr:NAD-dependent malic enzyme 62 kDa isoform, mitochondrial-like [Juglans regia]